MFYTSNDDHASYEHSLTNCISDCICNNLAKFNEWIHATTLAICFTLAKYTVVFIWYFWFALLYTPPEAKPAKPPYIPKRQREKMLSTKVNKWIWNIGGKIAKRMELFIDSQEDRSRWCANYRITRNKLNRLQNCRPIKRGKMRSSHLLALSVLAMSTQIGARMEHITAFDTDTRLLGIDNRCSASMSSFIGDFVGPMYDCNRKIKGVNGQTTFRVKRATMKVEFCDGIGRKHKFLMPNSYYVQGADLRLFSPQHWAKCLMKEYGKKAKQAKCTTYHDRITLQWGKNRQYSLEVPLTVDTQVGNIPLAPGYDEYGRYCRKNRIPLFQEEEAPIIAEDTQLCCLDCEEATLVSDKPSYQWNDPLQSINCNFDLNAEARVGRYPKGRWDHQEDSQFSKEERHSHELLMYHQKMGHASFQKLQTMAKEGSLPHYLHNCKIPVCSSCLFAKMTRKPWRSKPNSKGQEIVEPSKPGEVVAVDHMISPTKGLIAQMTGKPTTQRYTCATVFVDMYSRLGYVYLQKGTSAEETLKAKQAFELHARGMGISIQGYHADNGTFRANAWVNACNRLNQRMTFAGVNAHHQNGVAERRIRELQDLARSMLMHANRRWPCCITANLWPYAVRMANESFNNVPNMIDPARRSPLQIFSGSKVHANPKHFQPFGCPAYVLDNDLQSKKQFHKWKERSRVGIYLGPSPHHGKNVALILDRSTGLVSPQFHIKYDPSFQTVKDDDFKCEWQIKCGFKTDPRKQMAPIQAPADIPTSEGGLKGMLNSEGVDNGSEKSMNNPSRQLQPNSDIPPSSSSDEKKTLDHGQDKDIPKTSDRLDNATGSASSSSSNEQASNDPAHDILEVMMAEVGTTTTMSSKSNDKKDQDVNNVEGELLCLEALYPEGASLLEQEQDPLFAYKATADPDTMYMHEAMKQPDKAEFKAAMVKEVKDQMDNGNFTIVLRANVPIGKTILPAVWQMKRKRDIKTRKVKKWKARLNIDGSRMKKGIHYDQTYSPVASWKSIRLLLMMIAKNKWHSRQIDYVLAFPQAPVEKEIYMEIPKGFQMDKDSIDEGKTSKDYVLRLNRNVYGQKQASRVWYQYLSNILINELGFTRSKIDECVFTRGKTIYVLYTDDSLIAGPDKNEIEQIIQDIRNAKLNITDEGDIRDFLGINIEMTEDGSVKLTQPHLIDQILNDLKMTDDKVKGKTTPALSSKLLTRNANGEDFDGSFHYRSIIGKLNYLEKGTRSDISYITHQLARFTENPKDNHAKAVRWLARYLKATRDKGLIIKPDATRSIDVYVDADFSGNWDKEGAQSDRDTARSRHGYFVMYNGCPMIWKSQLQGEIALSSTESEYIGLSYALREVIPIMGLLKELKSRGFEVGDTVPKVHCKVFEDNSGALEMAKEHKYRPRTKHLNVKLHHFRDYVDRGEITIHKIETQNQLADYLTKPVTEEILVKLRRIVMGW